MTTVLSPFTTAQFVDANGAPRAGAQLFIYLSGTEIPAAIWRDSAGTVACPNPIICNTRGEISDPAGNRQAIWQNAGETLDYVLAPPSDTSPPNSPYWSILAVPGVNDITAPSGDGGSSGQWITGSLPAFIDSITFTVAGDQTSIYTPGRRVHTINSGADVYSTVVVSTYTTFTTVVVSNDSSPLSAGLSLVQYGLLTSVDAAVPGGVFYPNVDFAGLTNFNQGLGPTHKHNYSLASGVSSNALTITLNDRNGQALALTNKAEFACRSNTADDGKPQRVQLSSSLSVVVPHGATLGFLNGETSYIDVYLVVGNTTQTLGLVSKDFKLDESFLYTTTALSAGSSLAATLYTSSVLVNASVRYLGRARITTGATAGDWSNAPTELSPYGDQVISPGFPGSTAWQNGGRALNTLYQNTSSLPLCISCKGRIYDSNTNHVNVTLAFKVGPANPPTYSYASYAVTDINNASPGTDLVVSFIIIPPGHYFEFDAAETGVAGYTPSPHYVVDYWAELK